MKLFILFPFLIFLSINLNAQDIITLKNNGLQVKVVVESIDGDQIRYKKFGQKKGTVFSIPVADVIKVVYESGEEKIFESPINNSEEIQALPVDLPVSSEDSIISESEEKTVKKEDQPEYEYNTQSTKKERKKFKMKLGLGALVGANMTTIKYAYNEESVDLGNTYRLGLAGGFMLEWEIWKVFSLYSGLYYKDKGDKINGKSYVSDWEFPTDNPIVYTAEGSGYINKHLGYLEWSFMPLFAYTNPSNSMQIQLGGGVYAAIGLTGKEKIDMSITYYRNGDFDETEEINKSNSVVFVQDQVIDEKLPDTHYYNMLDFGFMFYLGVKPRPFIANLQLAWGKANSSSLSMMEILTSGQNIKTSQNLTLTLAVGYIL